MLTSTTLRVENNILETIGQMAAKKHLDRGSYMRQLLMRAYREEILDKAIEEYRQGKISVEEIANTSGRTLWEVLDVLKERRIPSTLALEDVEGTSSLK